MAVSQGWSGWEAGGFDQKGKILQFTAMVRDHLRSTAQKLEKKRLGYGDRRSQL
jgi:hypothetical protein